MPYNLLKKYNQLLEISSFNDRQRTISLKGVFKRDFEDNENLVFNGKKIIPTTKEGELAMETLFRHLTTGITDPKTKKREFEYHNTIGL